MPEIPLVISSSIRPNVMRGRPRNSSSSCTNATCAESQAEINALKEKVASVEARLAALEALLVRNSASNAGLQVGGRKRKVPRDPPLSKLQARKAILATNASKYSDQFDVSFNALCTLFCLEMMSDEEDAPEASVFNDSRIRLIPSYRSKENTTWSTEYSANAKSAYFATGLA
ncbi:unnamed protein product [Mucor fragilis]